MKSGTSSLFHAMAQHPQLVPAKKKEIHYFDDGEAQKTEAPERSLNWYRSHFPLRNMMGKASMTYEATPKYICHPSAAKRIHDLRPDMKLILLLRDPTERAISHYLHSSKNSLDAELLHATMEEEIRLLAPAGGLPTDASAVPDYTSHVGRGLYQKQIDHYLAYFDRNRIFIINSEEFFDDPRTTLSALFEFLKIQTDHSITDLAPRNASKRPKQAWPRTRELLRSFFKPHNEDLFAFLGRRYDWNEAES